MTQDNRPLAVRRRSPFRAVCYALVAIIVAPVLAVAVLVSIAGARNR